MVSSFASTIILLPFVVTSINDDAKANGGGVATKGYNNYQQYSDKFAGPYTKFMSQGDRGGGGKDSPSKSNTGGYQQYYQQYVGGDSSKSSGQGGGGGTSASSKSNKAVYQQYYQQYLGGGSGKSGQGGYQQYYQQYMGGGKDSSSKSNIGGYQQYYQEDAGGSGNSGSGGYDQYYQQYIGGGSQDGSRMSDSDKYNQQQKKDARDIASVSNQQKDAMLVVPIEFFAAIPPMMLAEVTSCRAEECVKQWYRSNKADVEKYVPKASQRFALEAIEKEYKENLARVATNSISTDGQSASELSLNHPFVAPNTHAHAIVPDALAAELANIPQSVSSCTNKRCVEDWRNRIEANIKAYVPEDEQRKALARIQQEYEKFLARIAANNNSTNGTNASEVSSNHPFVAPNTYEIVPDELAAELAIIPPMVLAEVSACTKKQCVEDWRNRTEAKIETYVPKNYQRFALASVQKEYKKNLDRVAAALASNSTKLTDAFLALTKLNSQSSTALLFVAIALFALMSGFFVIRLRARQSKTDLHEDFLRCRPLLPA